MTENFTGSFTAGIKTYHCTFEPVRNDILEELYYLVTINGSEPFIMAYDNEKLQLVVQGAAPYIARDFENELSGIIESHNA